MCDLGRVKERREVLVENVVQIIEGDRLVEAMEVGGSGSELNVPRIEPCAAGYLDFLQHALVGVRGCAEQVVEQRIRRSCRCCLLGAAQWSGTSERCEL
jgi:hypothetical protein